MIIQFFLSSDRQSASNAVLTGFRGMHTICFEDQTDIRYAQAAFVAPDWLDSASLLHVSAFPVMPSFSLQILREPMPRQALNAETGKGFGDMTKAVVDVERGVMAIGAELHSDEEAALIEDGSRQSDLWGINLYPGESGEDWIEFDSMINVRPAHGNRSRGVEDEAIRSVIRRIVATLVVAE